MYTYTIQHMTANVQFAFKKVYSTVELKLNITQYLAIYTTVIAASKLTVVYCPLSDRVSPVFVKDVSPPLGWSPLSYVLVIWYPNVNR